MLNYKSRHVFGPEANVDGALLSGDIDFFDILFLDEGKIGWITETGEKFIIEDKVQVRVEDELPNEGVENVLFVCGKSLYVWDGSEYVLIVDDYMSLEDRVSKLEDASGQIDSHNTSDKAHADIRSIVSDNANEIAQIKNGAELETFADVESILMELAYGISGGSELETETNFIVPAINEVHFELDELKEALQELIIIDYTKLEFDVTELVSLAHIYGVSWDRTDTPVLTRIDEAASFPSPVVAVDTSVGSSPFDNLMPWAGMEKITDENGQSLVSIPKFWYRWTSTEDALTLQIADAPVNGFHVSPMHADRGDGKGERDVAYIGRYHCAVEGALMGSITNALPLTDVPRTGARYGITSAAGDGGYFLQDFAAWWTIRMLFLVEYATWDGQAVIGEGNISGSIVKNGATDNMIYHTGMVTVANGDAGNQYRWIENPWSNVGEWIDGITFDGADIYIFNNPEQMSDDVTAEGAVKLSYQRSTDVMGWIQDFGIPDNEGLEYALYPTKLAEVTDMTPKYIGDACIGSSGGVVLVSGGVYASNPFYGPFMCIGGYGASGSFPDVGARLQKLP